MKVAIISDKKRPGKQKPHGVFRVVFESGTYLLAANRNFLCATVGVNQRNDVIAFAISIVHSYFTITVLDKLLALDRNYYTLGTAPAIIDEGLEYLDLIATTIAVIALCGSIDDESSRMLLALRSCSRT